jgi:hypothetical protein
MSALYTRESAIVAVTGVDFSTNEGYLLKNTAGVLAVNDSASVPAVAVVLEGNVAAKDSAIGILGALSGTVRLKTSGAITKFDLVQQAADGTIVTDAGTGSRVIVGRALEAAASGDLIEVATLTPRLAS